MENTNKRSFNEKSHIVNAASELLNEGKKYANELYKDGVHKVTDAEEQLKDYTDSLSKKVKANPIASVLIAGGIGYLLSKLLK